VITLDHYLVLGGMLFCIGLFGALAKRNAIAVLMGIELMLNAVNVNLVAFNHFLEPDRVVGQIFVIFVVVVAAAEVAVALALVINIYRRYLDSSIDDLNWMKW